MYRNRTKPNVATILSDSVGIVSLDVFDTTLTRLCGAPEALYLWLGRRLYRRRIISCTPETFARTRAHAEKEVWHRAGGMDSHVTLRDFYTEVVRRLWIDERYADLLTEMELELEAEVLRGVPTIISLVRRASEAKKTIAFTTDTYFQEQYVRKQLKANGAWTDSTKLLASSSTALSKVSGKLFDRLLDNQKGSSAFSLIHIGDNPHSDVDVPLKKNIRSSWFAEGRLNRYEQVLSDARWATGGLSAALAGASRFARLNVEVAGTCEAAIRDVAAGVAGPILIGYVLWLLKKATDLGITTLYFCSRDGQVLEDIARRLLNKLNWTIQTSYLYVSRDSVNLAAIYELNDDEIAWVVRDLRDSTAKVTPRALLARFDLLWGEASAELQSMGFHEPDRPIEQRKAQCLKEALSGCLRERILEKASSRRHHVLQYLAQEGLLKGNPIGIVDFGGVGSQLRALHALITSAGAPPPKFFLIGMDSIENLYDGFIKTDENPSWIQNTHCYLYDHRRNLGIKRRRGFGTCVQMFCAANHGTVTGYKSEGESIAPCLMSHSDRAIVDWGLPLMRRTLYAVVENLVIDEELVDIAGDLRQPACEVIDAFWTQPSVDEAVAWGAFPLEGAEAMNSMGKQLVDRYSLYYIMRQILLRRPFPDLGWQHWYEGSLRISPTYLQFILRTAQKFFNNLRSDPSPRAHFLERMIRAALRQRRSTCA